MKRFPILSLFGFAIVWRPYYAVGFFDPGIDAMYFLSCKDALVAAADSGLVCGVMYNPRQILRYGGTVRGLRLALIHPMTGRVAAALLAKYDKDIPQ